MLPLHAKIDQLREDNKNSIGTTRRGIGPAYEDKTARRSIKAFDLEDNDLLETKLKSLVEYYNYQIQNIHDSEPFVYEEVYNELMQSYKKAAKYFGDVTDTLENIYEQGGNILYEGAQGTLLDVDYGTYPYVTSSNTLATSVGIGSGFPKSIYSDVLGVAKAYTTRVGAGPFPTELKDKTGELLGTRGNEFGTVTSRKRRCGWFDGVLVRQTIKISGIDGIALTKLDVLDELDEIKMCVEYDLNGKKIDYLPAAVEDQLKIKPIYKTFDGWKTSTNGVKNINDLPENAKKYLFAIEDFIGAKISSISTSPERDDTILVENPFEI